jgi:hypothetical protein
VRLRPIHFVPDLDAAHRVAGIALELVADEPLEGVERRLCSAGFPPDGAIVDQQWARCLFVRAPDGTDVQIHP